MIITDALKKAAGQLTKVFDTYEEEGEEPETIYPYSTNTKDNTALAPEINTNKNNNNLKVITPSTFKGGSGYDVMICEPNSFDKSVELVKLLKDKRAIIVNLHLLDTTDARRLVDFLCGATHALNGNQQKIGENVFIFTPVNVSLSAESQKNKLVKDALWN